VRARYIQSNRLQYALQIREHLIVPESKYTPTVETQDISSLSVFGGRLGMLTTVEFDREIGIDAREVDNVTADPKLAAKFGAIQSTTSDMAPQKALSACLIPSQRACVLSEGGCWGADMASCAHDNSLGRDI